MGSGPSLLDRRILVMRHWWISVGGNHMAGTKMNNVFDLRPPDMEFSMCFDAEDERIGTLTYDADTKKLNFDGNVDAAGALLFSYVCEHFNGLPAAMGRYETQAQQLRFNLTEAYGRIERLKEQVLELELAVATIPE